MMGIKYANHSLNKQAMAGDKAYIVGLSSIDNSFLRQSCPVTLDFNHPDVPPLMVVIE